MLRVFLKKLLSVLGYNLVNTKLLEDSDDPFLVISRIFKCESIRTIIDGGASIGETSLRFLTLFPESKVYMFEPYSGFKQYLEEKESLYSNLIYEPCALSNCQSYKLLQINESKGTNSILHGDSIGKEIYGSQFKNVGEEKIKCITLDLWFNDKEINSIDILKLDVQGTEIDVLEGAKNLFSKNMIRSLIVEINFQECYEDQKSWVHLVNNLTNSRFHLFNLYNPYFYSGRLVQADAIFIHDLGLKSLNLRSEFHDYSKYLRK